MRGPRQNSKKFVEKDENLRKRNNRLALDVLSSGQSEQTEIQFAEWPSPCDGRTFSIVFAHVVDVSLQ
jgi:hypothetical protein